MLSAFSRRHVAPLVTGALLIVLLTSPLAFAQAPTTQTPAAAPINPVAPAVAPDTQAPAAVPTPSVTPTAASTVAPAAAASPVPDVGLKLPRDLSPWGMFMAADIVVKAVMIGLAFASVLTWTIWFAKAIELMVARRRMRGGNRGTRQARTLRRRPSRRWKTAATRGRVDSMPPTPNCGCRPTRSIRTA